MRALAIAGELGFGVAGPLVICTGLGWYLDGQWGTRPWLVLIGLGIGLVGMFGTFYRLATAFPARIPKKGNVGSAPPAEHSEDPLADG